MWIESIQAVRMHDRTIDFHRYGSLPAHAQGREMTSQSLELWSSGVASRSNLPRGIAGDDMQGSYVLNHHSPRADHGGFTDCNARANKCLGSNPCVIANHY
jgi:hypothetical protein